ncbi:beta-N-acetylhexosaminidase [Streptomyces candidus]|uniref:Hexosaminidase n=1 Tax=Streptomyces candidus TaxID=67283 RepID=A0A7X0HCI6_9ACTN|nr:glycoside hydrolase family 20 protein [Streptomyces candidus]MBB6435050.1 hexosaminidase [Streptomyces candidus]
MSDSRETQRPGSRGPGSRVPRAALAVGAAVVIGAAATVTVAAWPDATGRPTGPAEAAWSEGAPSESARSDAKAAAPSSPGVSARPVTGPARSVPLVREQRPVGGQGWRPLASTRVVVAAGSEHALADEGRLLAGELGKRYAQGVAARPGDVELVLGAPGVAGVSRTPESYTVTTGDGRVRITGGDEAGVFYGTRTLKQAVRSGGGLTEGVLRDAPAKPRRGFALDTARKHFDAEWIEDRIREMGDLKLNEFGLHFSDDQGFRIASASHPEIVSESHLTHAEVRRIVALAASRHIRVIPEIDSPGHLGAVIAAHPDLQLRSVSGKPSRGAVDIANPKAARIVDELFAEYARLFRGTYWHLGGDEYRALTVDDPEATYPRLAREAKRKYGPRARVQDLATGWLNDRAAVIAGHGKTDVRAWNDGYFAGGVVDAPKSREVAYWTGKEIGARKPLEYLREGRRVLNVNDEYLYYVLGEPNTFRYPTGRRIYEEWHPRVLRGGEAVPARYDAQITGGQFAVWCDLHGAQTQDQVARGIRLPLFATAQKLWDPKKPALDWEGFKELAGEVE